MAPSSPLEKRVDGREAEVLLELDRLRYEDSLHEFVLHFWRFIDPHPYVDGWHIQFICQHLEAVTRGEIPRLLINIPPRMSKSSIVSVAWPAWVWIQRRIAHRSGPQVQFLYTSYAQSLSKRDAVKTRRLITCPEYQRLWGDRFQLTGDQNEKLRYDNDRGGYRLTTSETGGTTGEGGMIIVVDDPHNTIEIESEQKMDNTVRWWDESLSTRLNDQQMGAFVVVMQRLRENDLSGHILDVEADDWCHVMLPMRHDPQRHCVTSLGVEDPRTEEGELLCPNRINEASLLLLERRLGTFGTAGQLQQEPSPRGGGILLREHWKIWPPQGEVFTADGKPVKKLEFPPMSFILAYLDTAMTEKKENDFSALCVLGLWYDQYDLPQIMLMESWQERLRLDLLINKVVGTCQKRRVNRLCIEAKVNGFSVATEIERLTRGQSWSTRLDPVPAKMDKAARAHSVEPHWAAGQIWAPERKSAQMVIDQCAIIPKGKFKDLADAMVGGVRHLRDAGLLQTGDERGTELRRRLASIGVREPAYDV